MSDVLTQIVERKKSHVAACKQARSVQDLEKLLPAEPPRGFRQQLVRKHQAGGLALIAEIKKASPSKGLIRADFDPPSLADAYAAGGAVCLSVLTDEPYFQGQDSYIQAARDRVSLPVLRKDFTIDPYQVIEARMLGADCILLIMAALDDDQASELKACAEAFGMDVLIEVHDQDEMDRALKLGPSLLGVNNRNLKTLAIDLATFETLAANAPADCVLVAESGLYSHEDVQRMAAAGAHAYLVGESLMRQADVTAATRALLGLAA